MSINRLICILLTAGCAAGTTTPAGTVANVERDLESLRNRYHVPGMSAIIDGPGGVLLEHGFGFANVARQDPVTPATLFHLASLTKPFAAVIAMQLHQEGLLDLTAPVLRYGLRVPGSDTVRVWHLLSHTSESTPPGTSYRYNGNRFGLMEGVFKSVSSTSFAELYDKRIRSVLSLESTIPGLGAAAALATISIDPAPFATRIAQGYTHSEKAPAQMVAYESYFGPAAGLISTPRDIVRFSRALDEGLLVTEGSRTLFWTPITTPAGATVPYGLGWFVQKYQGETLVWHYGLWTGASALIIKVPARRLTFVLLANSPGLSQPFPLAAGDITKSPFAMVFLRAYVTAR